MIHTGTISSPWKPCDVRGIYPDAISEDMFRRIGAAVGSMLPLHARVLISGDFRLSTPTLKHALTEGLLGTGVTVLDAGMGPTPLAYFAAAGTEADALLMITASHNPTQYNGLKLMLGDTAVTPQQIDEIRRRSEAVDFRSGAGKYERVEILPAYEETILSRWKHLDSTIYHSIVLDAGNGAWSEVAPEIFCKLGFKVDCISCRIDGSFPDRSPDCSRPENLENLRKTVMQQTGALGIAWDGDGDRVAFVDADGSYVSADELSILMARSVLERHKASGLSTSPHVVIDLKFPDAVQREVIQYGGIPLLERSGHAFMRGRMTAEDALLGLDACGHYFHRELRGGDDGLFSAFFVLDLIQNSGHTLKELRSTLPQIFTTPELRIPISLLSYTEAARSLSAAFPDAQTMTLDGTRLITHNGIVLVRESGTEPVVSLRIEGHSQAELEQVLAQSFAAIPAAAPLLWQQVKDGISN